MSPTTKTSREDLEKYDEAGMVQGVTSVIPEGDTPVFFRNLTEDERALVALGYKQEFKREFGLWTVFCVSFSVLGLLPSVATTLWYGMGYAGTAGMVWGWLIAMVGIQCVAMSMAELASSMPTSGGLYYAASVLAPEGWGPLAAWITGWSNWLGQVTAAPSVDYGCASMILATATVYNPSYSPTITHTFLLTTLILIIHGFISSSPTWFIARFNSLSTYINLSFLIVFLIIIPSATTNTEPRFNDSKAVWGTIENGTSWPNGIAVLMSFISVIWTMSGYDAPFHLSEECSNAVIAAPRAIVLTSGVGGMLGWFMMLVIAYTVRDIPAAIESEVGQPFIAYLLQVLTEKTAIAVACLTIVASFFMGQGCMVAASRVTYAYGRDEVFPFSLSRFGPGRVNSYTNTPVNAVALNTVIAILVNLLMFGGDLAIGAIFSIGAIGAYVAFTLPVMLRTFVTGDRFRAGPWNLGRFSKPCGCIATAFTVLMVPILCLPTVKGADLDATTMNWTVVVYGGPMFLAMVWWWAGAKKWFKGPKINIEHRMLERSTVQKAQEAEVASTAPSFRGEN